MKLNKSRTAAALVLLLISTVVAVAYVIERRRKPLEASRTQVAVSALSQPSNLPLRNLSLQPEALAVARRLGTRFAHGKRAQSTVVGALTIGTETRIVQMVRTQTDNGEQVHINVAGRGGVLAWDSNRGALSGAAPALGADRDLIERLVFDSPDQLVLAQLRGASYFTVARNVRPVEAGEDYRGPLWTIVRVNDPERDESKAPQSRWRLYYIDTATGLIDRIESEVNGRRIVAELSGWTEQNGQRVATALTWKQDGQLVMQYRVTSFGHVDR